MGHKLEFDPVKSLWVFKVLRGNEHHHTFKLTLFILNAIIVVYNFYKKSM